MTEWHRSLVDLLCEASGDNEPARDDVELAEAAEEWMLRHGWKMHWRLGFISPAGATALRPEEGDPRLLVVERVHNVWNAVGEPYRVPTFRAALNQLVVLGHVPARFSTFGRDALHEHAEACEVAADVIVQRAEDEQGRGKATGLDLIQAHRIADGMREAAASARRHYPLRVPS